MVEVLKKLGFTILDIAAFLIIAGVISFILVAISTQLLGMEPMDEEGPMDNPLVLISMYLPLLIAALVAGYVTHTYIFRRDTRLFGIGGHRLIQDYGLGFVVGAILVIFGFFLLRVLGFLDIVGYNMKYVTIALFLLFFIFQSLFEEIVFRSYLMPALESRFGLWISLVVSSILFAAIHLSNSNVSVIGMLNIFAAGLLLGVVFIKYQNVWMAAGLHCSWNYIQSTILGFEVSGESMFNMIETEANGPDMITGGAFGFEGSIIALLFLAGLTLYYLLKDPYVRSRLEGMPQIKEEEVFV